MKPSKLSKLSKAKRQLALELRALEGLSGIVRVQAHLGGMELKDAWHSLESRVAHARVRATAEIEATGDVVAEETLELLTRLWKPLAGLRARLARPASEPGIGRAMRGSSAIRPPTATVSSWSSASTAQRLRAQAK